jgi:hypothetical protein
VVFVERLVSDIMQRDVDYASLDRPLDNAFSQRAGKHLWEEREDVEAHVLSAED